LNNINIKLTIYLPHTYSVPAAPHFAEMEKTKTRYHQRYLTHDFTISGDELTIYLIAGF
jgi:hypothetical protein